MISKLHPLVVDLDGTLIKTDLLIESFLGLMAKNPLYIFLVFIWLFKGKSALKTELSSRVELEVNVLPYNEDLLAYLKQEKKSGREIILATASHHKYAMAIAEHLDLFDKVFSTLGKGDNLSAQNKADKLCAEYGDKGFVYAGNAKPDLKVWKHSSKSIVVGHSKSLSNKAGSLAPIECEFYVPAPSLNSYIQAFRLHQWVKNVLIFLPVFAAHALLDTDLIVDTLLAFFAFSLCASSVYLLNDLLDLPSDRHHKSKCYRPFASGAMPALHGILLIPSILFTVILIATMLPPLFGIILFIYYIVTTAYSFALKKRIMIDVVVLACLYTIRIIAGSAATNIPLSNWLLVFSMFIFLSLALVKRYTELVDLRSQGVTEKTKGRGYRVEDIQLLVPFGSASGFISVLVLALYINSDFVQNNFQHSQLLWGICPLMLYWIGRMWMVAHRGEMHDDPIVYAIKNSVSRYTVLLMALLFMVAAL